MADIVNNVFLKKDSYVFVLAYVAAKEPVPSNFLKDLLVFTKTEQTPIIAGIGLVTLAEKTS